MRVASRSRSDPVTGIVFDIKKFAIHDGPGIRTTVFLKGCPLRCLWCHNPESQERRPEVSFMPEKCIACGWCFNHCPKGGHRWENGQHILDRSQCIRCGRCAEQCYAGANSLIGKRMGVAEVIDEVRKDEPFYATSGGGMTISGGEPMVQFAFTRALLQEAKAYNLHRCLDTCGFALIKRYFELLPLVDLFLYDLKETDPVRHEEYTGVALRPILDTLRALDNAGAAISLRCPIIPGLNDRDEHLRAIASVANSLKHLVEINLMPYHPLGESKLKRLGKNSSPDGRTFADERAIATWMQMVQDATSVPVSRG